MNANCGRIPVKLFITVMNARFADWDKKKISLIARSVIVVSRQIITKIINVFKMYWAQIVLGVMRIYSIQENKCVS